MKRTVYSFALTSTFSDYSFFIKGLTLMADNYVTIGNTPFFVLAFPLDTESLLVNLVCDSSFSTKVVHG